MLHVVVYQIMHYYNDNGSSSFNIHLIFSIVTQEKVYYLVYYAIVGETHHNE